MDFTRVSGQSFYYLVSAFSLHYRVSDILTLQLQEDVILVEQFLQVHIR